MVGRNPVSASPAIHGFGTPFALKKDINTVAVEWSSRYGPEENSQWNRCASKTHGLKKFPVPRTVLPLFHNSEK